MMIIQKEKHKESDILKLLVQGQYTGFPLYICSGKIEEKYSYLIMSILGNNLRDLSKKTKNNRFTFKTVVQIGLQLIDRFKDLHKLGYIYCDLKPENILLGNNNVRSLENSIIYLIDFCISKSYLESDFNHIAEL